MRWGPALLAHAVASAVFAAVTFVAVAVGYVGLLLWAVAAGEPLGGPFALLGALLTAAAVVPAAVLLALLPATTLARVVRRGLRWSWWVEAPLAVVWLVLLVAGGYGLLVAFDRVAPSSESAQAAGALAGALLLPLGLYWWAFTATDGIVRVALAVWRRIAAPSGPTAPPAA